MNQYIVPDIHGCAETLQYVVKELIKPGLEDPVYFLGDFINKGPDSRGVIDFILSMENSGYPVRYIRGNHEQLLLDALEHPGKTGDFISKGGDATLKSFNVADVIDIPAKYINFIKELPYYIELEDFIIVHAGLNFEKEDPYEDKNSMLNIRDFPVIPSKIGGKKIIHGHNASSLDQILGPLFSERHPVVNLDNGCAYKERKMMGNLVVLNLNTWSVHIQPCID